MFTAAMRRCALFVTKTPGKNATFRVFHNQHPEMVSIWQAMGGQGITGVIYNIGYTDYGNHTGVDGEMTNAFNIL